MNIETPIAFDKQGTPIDALRWGILMNDREYSQIGDNYFSGIRVSTVWLGINHNYHGGPPIIFETMFFGGPLDCWTVGRYATEDEAKFTHESVVESFRNGEAWAVVLEAARQLQNGRERHGWIRLARGYLRHYRKSVTFDGHPIGSVEDSHIHVGQEAP